MGRPIFIPKIQERGETHMAKYDVTITETLQTTVEIEARDRFHAEQLASDNWRNSEYILDAEHFQGVSFEARLQQKSRDQER